MQRWKPTHISSADRSIQPLLCRRTLFPSTSLTSPGLWHPAPRYPRPWLEVRPNNYAFSRKDHSLPQRDLQNFALPLFFTSTELSRLTAKDRAIILGETVLGKDLPAAATAATAATATSTVTASPAPAAAGIKLPSFVSAKPEAERSAASAADRNTPLTSSEQLGELQANAFKPFSKDPAKQVSSRHSA